MKKTGLISVSKYLIDTSAWLEYFRGTKVGQKVKEIVEDRDKTCMHCNIIMAEIASKATRDGQDLEKIFASVRSLSKEAEESKNDYWEAGLLHGKFLKEGFEMSLADAIIAVVAKRNQCKIVTKDFHLKKFDSVIV